MHGESLFDQPEYFGSIQGEALAASLLESVVGDKEIDAQEFTARKAGNLFIQSIDETDSRQLAALKRLSAKMCGVDNASNNYQKMIDPLDEILVADELRDFILHMYEWSHEGASNTESYINDQMSALSGFRVEASFAKLARAAGFDVREATHEEDLHGMDFRVDGIPFDLKSSEKGAIWHSEKHKKNSERFHPVVFVPPITAEDFSGRLVIPDENVERVLENSDFRKMVEGAIRDYVEVNNSIT